MNKTLITASLFSAIYYESSKDYLDIINPFVEYILATNYSVGEEITSKMINDNLCQEFYFSGLPLNVSSSILTRLQSRKKVLKKNGLFYLNYNFSKEAQEFCNRKLNISSIVKAVVSRLKTYINHEQSKVFNDDEIEIALLDFLNLYGYDTYFSNKALSVSPSKETLNYLIGKYINSISVEKDKTHFDDITKIIKGFMISEAVYLQVDLKNKIFLKNLTVYLDGPFLLRALGLKSEIENQAASELIKLLKSFGSRLKIFDHTLDEIINILKFYRNNKGYYMVSTIEKFDLDEYTVPQIDVYINELDKKMKKLGIVVENVPQSNDIVFEYENSLLTKLLNNYKKPNSMAPERDVLSVKAINILRKGTNHQRIEDCKYIFLTTYRFLRISTDNLRNDKNQLIGPVITDVDLTTILWLKNLTKENDMPKMRLLENALSAIEPTNKVIEKTAKIVKELEAEGELGDEEISQGLALYYLRNEDYVDVIKNDEKNVTKDMVKKMINRDKNLSEELKELNNENLRIKKEKEMMHEKYNKLKENRIKTVEQNAEKIKKVTKFSLYFAYCFLLLLIVYGVQKLSIIFSETYLGWILNGVILIVQIILFATPKLNFPKMIIDKISDKTKFKFIEKGRIKIDNEMEQGED